MSLTDKDVLQILTLVEESDFDLLQLEYGDLKLTISKSGNLPAQSETAWAELSVQRGVDSAPRPGAVGSAPAPAPERQAPVAGQTIKPAPTTEDGLVAIKAPIVGTFYGAPEPGAPPFVTVGAEVDDETTVGLLEVMKVYSGVKAGVKGKIEKVLVENAQFVEYGQPLFLVRADEDGTA